MPIKVRLNGVDYPTNTDDPAEAESMAREMEQAHIADRTTGERVGRDVKSTVTGVRQFAEGMGGLGGDLPGMAEGATEYAGHKLQQVPFLKEHISEGAVQGAGDVVNRAIANLNPLAKISRALQAMGVIGPDTAITPAMINPTSQDVHGAVSSVLDKGGRIGERLNEATSYQPTNMEEKGFNFAGNFIPGMATGTSELKMAQSVPDMLKALMTRFGARTAAPAIALTGTEAAVEHIPGLSEEDKTAIKTVVGALSAFPAGAVERSSAIKAAAGQVTKNPQALRVVHQALLDSGLDQARAIAKLKDMGVSDTMLVDLGPNMKQLGLVASGAPGPGREQLHTRLEERHKAERDTLGEIRKEAVGEAPNKFTVAGEIKAAKDRAAEGYEPAYAQQNRPADTQHLVDELDTKLGRAKDPESRAILNKIKNTLFIQDSIGTAKPHLDPSVEGLHNARMSLRRMLEKAENKTSDSYSSSDAGLIRSYLTKIDNEIGSTSPAMKNVDVAFSKEAAHTKAFELGEEALNKGEGALNLPEFKQKISELPPEAHDRITEGLSHSLDLKLDRPNERTALRSWVGGHISEAKLAEVIGPEKTAKLMKELEHVDTKHGTYQTIVKGTKAVDQPKAEPGASQGALDTGLSAAVYSGDVLTGIGAGATKLVYNYLRNKLAKESTQKANAKLKSDIASLLARPDPENVLSAAAKMQQMTGKSALPSAMLNALVARRAGGPR